MKYLFVLFMLVTSQALAAEATVSWSEYNSGAVPNFGGIRVYINGVELCEQTDPAKTSVVCPVESVGVGVSSFTLTAFDTSGNESAHSTPIPSNYYIPKVTGGSVVIEGSLVIQ